VARGTKQTADPARDAIALASVGARPIPAAIPPPDATPFPAPREVPRAPPSPRERHGPQRPVKVIYGVAHLCTAQNLSPPRSDAELQRLCEDAACEIERLRALERPRPWTD
jgi:hypothetical protein